jgi:hypothetical protein
MRKVLATAAAHFDNRSAIEIEEFVFAKSSISSTPNPASDRGLSVAVRADRRRLVLENVGKTTFENVPKANAIQRLATPWIDKLERCRSKLAPPPIGPALRRAAIDMRPDQWPCLFCAFLFGLTRAKADARDWLEKTEDWQVETGRGARSVVAGGTIRSLIKLCGFAARKRSARYDRTNFHPHREPETRVSPCLARKHRRHRLRPRRRPQRQIPDHEARHRRRVCRGRLVDPAIERPFANFHASPLRHLPASRRRTLRLSRTRQGDGGAAPACCEGAAAAHAHDR